MTTQDTWMPPKGRHPVTIGSSLTRVLRTRKGLPTKLNKNLPVKDFYLFRYNFKPESVDSAKPGTLEVTQGQETTSVRIERASHQSDEVHVFRGKEEAAKEVECVLIYNEAEGVFTLEKLDSYLILSHDGKAQAKPRRFSASPFTTSSAHVEQERQHLQAQLEHDLLGSIADVEAEIDSQDSISRMSSTNARPETKKVVQRQAVAVPEANTRPKLKAPPRKPLVQPIDYLDHPAKGKAKREQSPPVDIEEEDLQFGQPAKAVKRSQPSPTPPQLALPSSSTTPLSQLALAPPSTVGVASAPMFPSPGLEFQSESEEEWDDVMENVLNDTLGDAADGSAPGGDAGEAEEDAGEEIDENLFAAELDRELGGDEDGEEDVEASYVGRFTPARAIVPGRPMSLNQFAGGQTEPDEDDYTSSEESDDD